MGTQSNAHCNSWIDDQPPNGFKITLVFYLDIFIWPNLPPCGMSEEKPWSTHSFTPQQISGAPSALRGRKGRWSDWLGDVGRWSPGVAAKQPYYFPIIFLFVPYVSLFLPYLLPVITYFIPYFHMFSLFFPLFCLYYKPIVSLLFTFFPFILFPIVSTIFNREVPSSSGGRRADTHTHTSIIIDIRA